MLAIYTIAAFSQVTLGDGDASQDIPVDPFYGYSYSQTIYTSSQIAASGEITAISYYVDPGTTIGSSDDWKIFLAHTSLTQLTGWILDSLLTEVYAGQVSISNNEVMVTLDSSFMYNGSDNLLVAVLESKPGYDNSSDHFYSTLSTAGTSISYNDDWTPADPANPPTLGSSSIRAYFSNITFHGITQACPSAQNLSADDITSNSVVASWDLDIGSTFHVVVDTSGFNIDSASYLTTTADSFLISNLNSNTDYQLYARKICTSGDTSGWSGPVSFKTLCTPFIPDYEETFDSYIPDCWEEREGVISDSTTFTDLTSSWTGQTFSGSNAAEVGFSLNVRDWLISPTIDLGDGSVNYQLTFDASTSGFSTNVFGADDTFSVVISTDELTFGHDGVLQSWYQGLEFSSTGENVIIDLSGYTGEVKFGFYAYSPIYNNYVEVSIDNVKVVEEASCTQALDLESVATSDTSAFFILVNIRWN